MDIRKVFRDLVSGQYVPDFDYVNTEFTFETVFERTAYAYRICICGYEHEYLSYISESGEIDERIYAKIVRCIVDGKCPHVDTNSRANSPKARITGIHVSAAVGAADVFKILQKEKLNDPFQRFWDFAQLQKNENNIFGIDPYILAIQKKKIDIAILPVMQKFTTVGTRIARHLTVHAKQVGHNTENWLVFEEIPILEFIVGQKNSKLLRCYLDLYGLNKSVGNAIRYTVNHNLHEIQKILLRNIEWYMKPEHLYVTKHILRLAIVFNQTCVLEDILRKLVTSRPKNHELCQTLSKICYALERNECEEILSKYRHYNKPAIEDMTEYHNAKELVDLLIEMDSHFYDAVHPQLMPWLSPDIPGRDLSYNQQRMSAFLQKCRNKLNHSDKESALKLVLEFRSIVLQREGERLQPFMDCLNLYSTLECVCSNAFYRQIAESFIYENSELDIEESALKQAVNIDKRIHKMDIQSCSYFHFMNEFSATGVQVILDGKTHAIIGHDDEQQFALNFMTPLLTECGYTISKDVRAHIESALMDLHPAERDYFERTLNTPRSLKLSCCNCLRRHFKGKEIHQFVENGNIPKPVRDLILLKPLLKCMKI